MIPLHIRCTQRNRIDPGYPMDDAAWWRMEESKRDSSVGPGERAWTKAGSQQELLEFIKESGGANTLEIGKHFGWGCDKTRTVVMGLSFEFPIYEESAKTFPQSTRYALLA